MNLNNLKVIYGPPGTGKTSYLVGAPAGRPGPTSVVEHKLNSGIKPNRIGYVAFTKKAASEALERACQKFELSDKQLPYFRTIHSLAFKQLGLKPADVMSWKHYREIGARIGVELRPKHVANDDWYGMDTGDRIMFLEGLARVKATPLKDVWRDANEIDIDYLLLERYAGALAAYKRENSLLDYTDMLERFVKSSFAAPRLDVLIVDEAQDLSPLQWKAVEHAASHAKEVYVAGDDLQAVFTWSGADVDTFLSLGGEHKVLEQSHRISAAVHRVASIIAGRITKKSHQVYRPRAEEGVERRYSDPEAVDLSEGTWLLLARNGYMLRQLEDMCMRHGWSFTSVDKSPLDSPALKAIISYEKMRKGQAIPKADALEVLKFISVSRIPEAQRAAVRKMGETATVVTATAESPIWHKALDLITPHEREYFIAARKRGETLTKTPRIRVSTIHASKGGEADNVMLLTDISQRTDYEMRRNPDAEHKVYYVGVTRARHGIHIIQPQTGTSYQI